MTTAIKTGTAAGTQAAGSPGICRYPGCASPARVKDPAAPGPRPGYCEQAVPEDRGDGTAVLVRHTAMTAFRHRQQLAGQPGQDRPVTAAISRAGAIRDDAVAAMSGWARSCQPSWTSSLPSAASWPRPATPRLPKRKLRPSAPRPPPRSGRPAPRPPARRSPGTPPSWTLLRPAPQQPRPSPRWKLRPPVR